MNATSVSSLILRINVLYMTSYKKERKKDHFVYSSYSDRRSQTRDIIDVVVTSFPNVTMPGPLTL
jgi:aspartate carbamoyltransferase catalytic subunit